MTYRDPTGTIAALERDVEALTLRTEKAIDTIAVSHQGILDNCRAGQPVDSGERATIGRPCPNLRGGREMNNRDCEHGQLGRTCPLCELEEELAEKAKTIAALEREVEALHKDAKRYQWLKSKRMFRLFSADMSGRHTFATVGRPIGSGRDIDEAIDVEISKALKAGEAQ